MKYLLLTIPTFYFNVSFTQGIPGGTCVIAKRNASEIIVGADRRIIISYPDRPEVIDEMCKIYNGDSINTAVIGLFEDIAMEISSEACLKQGVHEAMNYYSNVFGKRILDTLIKYRGKDLSYYYHLATMNRFHISEAVFFGRDADSLALGLVTFSVTTMTAKETVVKSEISTNSFYARGVTDDIEETVKDPVTWNGDTPEIIKYLIKKESKIHPRQVGENVNLLRVTIKTTEWITDNNCK